MSKELGVKFNIEINFPINQLKANKLINVFLKKKKKFF